MPRQQRYITLTITSQLDLRRQVRSERDAASGTDRQTVGHAGTSYVILMSVVIIATSVTPVSAAAAQEDKDDEDE